MHRIAPIGANRRFQCKAVRTPIFRAHESRQTRRTTAHWRIEMGGHEKHSETEIPDAMASSAPGPEGPDAMASSAPGPEGPDAMASATPGPDEEGPESMASRTPGPTGPDAMASGA